MAATGLLIVTNPRKVVAGALGIINQYVRKTLYIQLLPSNYPQPPKWRSEEWQEKIGPQIPNLCKTVMNVYSTVSSSCPTLDACVLLEHMKHCNVESVNTEKEVDVVIFDSGFKTDDIDDFIKSRVSNLSREYKVVLIPENGQDSADGEVSIANESRQESNSRSFDQVKEYVVLGGTFDRLHNGHKILLSEASLRCCKKLTIGVTDSSMIKNKLLCELIEPCEQRIHSVKEFVQDMDSSIAYEIVPIDDPFGPTKSDPSLQLIVVSGETYKGALKVNELRKENGLPILNIHEIPLLPNTDKQSPQEEDKMSSSAVRMRLLGTTIKPPEKQPKIPVIGNVRKVPYIIGLTGGIASGKSSVATRLETLGAALINCDMLGHQAYQKGQPCYDDVLKAFGSDIIGTDEQINRQSLGKIVFDDQEKLMLLNSIVWPHILELMKDSISCLASENKQIVVVEAAVLLKANWHNYCNEVWTCIIPQNEAIRRLQERTNLDYDECEKRVLAQIPNCDAVAEANVVISTLWSPVFTQKQVERGWEELQCRVSDWMSSQSS